VRYTPTDVNVADLLTKALPTVVFERLLKLARDGKRSTFTSGYEDLDVPIQSDLFMIQHC
jgi:hypothetical protein